MNPTFTGTPLRALRGYHNAPEHVLLARSGREDTVCSRWQSHHATNSVPTGIN